MAPDIIFPHLGIAFKSINKIAFSILGIDCYFYGIIVALGIFAGYAHAVWQAKKTNQDTDIYTNYLIFGVIFALIGARLYYVIFSWDQYSGNPLKIFAIKDGGLAIYGGIIGAVSSAYVYTKIKKYNFITFMDTGVCGLFVGQAIGRFGNFFNMEAFGDYTNSLFAMQLKVPNVNPSDITQKMLDNPFFLEGIQYIQVHPTFLYECVWNIISLILISLYRKHKKFEGEIVCLYFLSYGIGRFWIESLRTDQLTLFGIPVSQALSFVFAIASVCVIIFMRVKKKKDFGKAE